ncbi:MAG: nucleotidyltransferase family protein [Halanaerobiales bacterium]|nr:nucleotidyltransferase family protein [Halanaerobiales bacterium]
MKVDVVILAGAENKGLLRECSDSDYEALIEIKGVPMVKYVVQAALGAELVERVAVVGPVDILRPYLEEVDILVNSKAQIVENISAGIKALQSDRNILILTSDIPLIQSDTIDFFINQCNTREADCYYPIISKEANQSRFPGTQRTYARLRDGVYTGGNIFSIHPRVVDEATDFMRKLVTWRKNPLKLSQVFGLKFIFKFITGRLTISELEKRVHKITGFSAAALVCEYPEIGFDVDKPSDLAFMEKYIGLRQVN